MLFAPADRRAVLVLSLLAGLAVGGPATADVPRYTEEFGESVRAYLLDNPKVVLEVFSLLEAEQRATKAAEFQQMIGKHSRALFASGDARKGTASAPIVVVEFFDYQCGYCKAALPELTAALAGRDDVTVVLKEFPILGPASETAARLALAVRAEHGDGAYVAFHNALLALKGGLTDAILERLAVEAGFDYAALTERGKKSDILATIAENRRLAQNLGVNGTPAFVFQDELVSGLMKTDRLTATFNRLAVDQVDAE